MKSFRDYLSEEVLPTALVSDGSFDLEKDAVRAQINTILSGIASHSCVTPYHVLRKISKALAYFHIILPSKSYMEGQKGVEVYELQQFGHKMGMTDQGEFVSGVPSKFYLYMNYNQVMGRFVVSAKVVGSDELENLISLQEDAACRQMLAKASAPKELMHNVDDSTEGTKSAADTSQRKKDKKLSSGSLDEAMNRKQKDMAVRRFMSHDPKAGESILAMGKKEREEKKSFSSAKKEIKRLKEEEQIDEGMPASVIKHKQKLASMSPDDLKKKFAGKTEQELKSMAHRHGYGKDSDVYSKHVTKKLDEKHLTPSETRKKEEIVKSMKKGLSGFKERYGKRAKAVMYATATKQAEKIAEKLQFDPSTEIPRNMEEAMGSVKKNYGLRKMKTKAKTIVRRGLGKERETQTVLVTRKGDPHAAAGGGVRRIPKDKYDPKKHNLASE